MAAVLIPAEARLAGMLVVGGLAPATQRPGPGNVLDGPSPLASSDILLPALPATWRLVRHPAFPELVGAQFPAALFFSASGPEAPELEVGAASGHADPGCVVAEREGRSKEQSVGRSTPAR